MLVDRSGRTWLMRPDEMMIAQACDMREEGRETRAFDGSEMLEGSDFARVIDGVAVIPVIGMLMRKMSFWFWSYEEVLRDVMLAQADSSVRSIVLDIDSGGGLGAGCGDCARAIRESGPKRIEAFVGGTAASAAYWLASAADRITLGSGSMVGSIGTVIEYVDFEPVLEKMGARIVRVVAEQSPLKRTDPDSPEGRAEMQALVDSGAQDFIESIAAFRGVTTQQVMDRFGQGLVFDGSEAIERGMADGRGSFARLIADMAERGTSDPEGSAPDPTDPQAETSTGLAARGSINAGPATAAKEEPMDWDSITLAQLREHRADIVDEIAASAAASAGDETKAKIDAAVATERARISAIDEIATGAHGDLVAKAKADGWSAEKLALEMVKADKAAGAAEIAALEADDAVAAVVPLRPQSTTGTGAGATPEDKAKADWDKDANLRAEFGDDFDAYMACIKAETAGRVSRRGA